MTTLTKVVQESVRATFESIMLEEIERIIATAQQRLDGFANEQKRRARLEAQKMTLELFHKMDNAGMSVEFKL